MIESPALRDLDSALFKAFVFAARELNFTRAAEHAAMTQSGVSQQISKLESQVGQPLFSRVNKSIALTEAGRLLLQFIESQQDAIDKYFQSIGSKQRDLSGPVRYAMPHSCLFTPHFPLLLKASELWPDVSLHIRLCANEEIVDRLLRRELDFGFLTRKTDNPGIQLTAFAEEEYVLVGARSLDGLDDLNEVGFVDFPGMRNYFEIWKQAFAPKRRRLQYDSLKFKANINSLHAAVTMLTHGLGFAVVPMHVVATEISRGQLKVFSPNRRQSATSPIYIAELKGAQQPARVQTVTEAFIKMK